MAAIDTVGLRSSEPRDDAAVFGHPRGLLFLIFAEAWERFSFYGMQALLVLYMGELLLLPGHIEHVAGFSVFRAAIFQVTGPLSTPALASIIFGLYGGSVYVTPLIGGYVADRWFGRTRTVAAGALLMALGHFLMAFETSFLLALACLVVGVGGFKGNISTQVGELYAPGDIRRSSAFQLFYMGINFGLIFSPLVCGTLGEKFGWHWGFGAAGVGMLVGLAVYLSGRRWLPADAGHQRRAADKISLSPVEWRRVGLLVMLVPVLAVAAIGNYQIFNAYLVWAKASYDLTVFDFRVPVTWLLSFGGITSIGTITLSVWFWKWWATRSREPSEIGKVAIGAMIMAAAPLVLCLASVQAQHGHRVPLPWAVVFELINDLGYANLVPVSYALFTRASPASISGVMIGICMLQFFVANMLVGALGTLLEPLGGPLFWLLHAGLAGGASLVLLIVWRLFGRTLSPTVIDTSEANPGVPASGR